MKPGAALFVTIALSWPVGALADERVSVRWKAPAECPTEASVREQVLARLPPGAPLRIDATATRVRDGYHLALTVDTGLVGASGERSIDARDCKTLVSSMAVIAAMAAHQALAAAKPAEPSPSPSPAPSPPEPPPPRPQPPPSLSRPPRIVLRPEATFDVGTLPAAAPGFGIAAGLDLPSGLHRLRFEGYGGITLEQDAIATLGRGASFSIRTAGGRACFVVADSTVVQARACAGGEASSVVGEAFGVARTTELSSLVFAVRADAMVSVGLLQPAAGPSLALQLGVGLSAPTRRESFVILPLGTIHERGPLALRAFVGPELGF